jgi:hypothetical protein
MLKLMLQPPQPPMINLLNLISLCLKFGVPETVSREP